MLHLGDAFKKYNVILYNYVYLRVQDRQSVEDIVQEVFFKAHRSRATFDPEKSSLKNWLFKIAINAIYDFLNSKKNISKLENEIEDQNFFPAEIAKNDLANFVFQKMKSLSERDQEILILRYKSDLKIKEIAQLFEMTEDAVKVAIHRALKKLKDLCEE